MLNSDYQVQNLSGGQLLIIAPSELVGSIVLFAVGLVPTIFFTYRMFKASSLYPALGILLFGLPFMFCGYLASRTGTLTLDKAANTAFFHEPRLFRHDDAMVSLHRLRFATIRTMRASSYIAVVLDSGDEMTFADSTDQGGKGRAVAAINQYLGAGDH